MVSRKWVAQVRVLLEQDFKIKVKQRGVMWCPTVQSGTYCIKLYNIYYEYLTHDYSTK